MLIRKKHRENEEAGQERYLLTYADLITLLLGLFVILYATAQVDEVKYKQFSKAFSEVFNRGGGGDGVLEGGKGVLTGDKGTLDGGGNKAVQSMTPFKGNESIEAIGIRTKELLKSYLQDGRIEMRTAGKELIMSLPEKLLFESAEADIKTNGRPVIDTIAGVLKFLQNRISIDGHTDADQISSFKYASNWHLSTQRALTIGYYMIAKGMQEANVSIRGFGAQRPITSNNTEEGKAKNRRVEITISELNIDDPTLNGYKRDDTKKYLENKKQ